MCPEQPEGGMEAQATLEESLKKSPNPAEVQHERGMRRTAVLLSVVGDSGIELAFGLSVHDFVFRLNLDKGHAPGESVVLLLTHPELKNNLQ